jgi:hypothetical protein
MKVPCADERLRFFGRLNGKLRLGGLEIDATPPIRE